MGKRRTRQEKEKAIHSFSLSWSPEATPKGNVKRQFKNEAKAPLPKANKQENAMILAKDNSLRLIKKDIFKSLVVASLIVAFEVVLYLAWRK
jgi:hypothetical protein